MAIIDNIIQDNELENRLIDTLPLRPDMSGDDLQARFDALGLLIKDRLNTLITELVATTAAAQLGAVELNEYSGDTVGEQLAYLLSTITQGLIDVTAGELTVGSVTDDKLAEHDSADPPNPQLITRFNTHVTDTADNPAHAAKFAAVASALAGKAALSHTHAIGDVSGKVPLAQLPTGTTTSTVALGKHTHVIGDVSGKVPLAQIPTGTTTSTVALGAHTHGATDINTGTLGITRIPTGTTGTTVAFGNHTHTALTALTISGDRSAGSTGVVNIYYNQSSPPAASSVPIGTLYIKYT